MKTDERARASLTRQVALTATLIATTLPSLPSSVHAQVRGSERSRVSQVSDGTTVTIDYARPLVRGRLPVFGGLVAWGHTWTPGANEATTLEVDKAVTLNGVDVPEGRYSVWMIPSETQWEIVLDPNDRLYHTQPPDPRPEQIQLSVTPEAADFVEALTWDFPLVTTTGMGLRFRWASTSIPLDIGVEPTRFLTVDADAASLLVGTYTTVFEGPPPPEAPPGAAPPEMQFELRYEDDRIIGGVQGAPPGLPSEFTLLPVADLVFNPAWMMDGEIFETEVDMFFEFILEDGQVVGFDVRGLEDRLMMRGRRAG